MLLRSPGVPEKVATFARLALAPRRSLPSSFEGISSSLSSRGVAGRVVPARLSEISISRLGP
jgi:hypothetical protein